MLLDGPAVALAEVVGDDRFGLDQGGLQLVELGSLALDLRLDQRLHRGDLAGERLQVGLLGGELLGLFVDLFHLFEHLAFELLDDVLVQRDLVLDRLVLVVLLDRVELDLQVVDLGLNALNGVFLLLELHPGVLMRLLRGLQGGLAVGQGKLPGGEGLGSRGQPVANRLGALMKLMEFTEVGRGGGKGHDGSQGW